MQVVLLGYGGPESPDDVRAFLDRIVAGRPIPAERYEAVLANYAAIGGSSPFNAYTRAQAEALRRELERRRIDLPVRAAYRFAPPFIADLAQEAAASGEQTIAVILAAQQSQASWDKYVELFPGARFTQPFYEHAGFIAAHVDRIREAMQTLGVSSFAQSALIFTAHSIPQAMARQGPYLFQLNASAERIARAVGADTYYLAYTSRTGSPREPWLEPDVRDLLGELANHKTRQVVVDPLGFLCDHVEVLYDLDVAAADVARELSIRFARAPALNDHPQFIAALADAVQACLV